MPVDINFIDDDIETITVDDVNNLEVTAMGDLYVRYANSNHPQTAEEVFEEPLTDGVVHRYIGFYVGIELPLPDVIPTVFNWCLRDVEDIHQTLNHLENDKQDKLNETQMNAVNSRITLEKVETYDEHVSNKNNPHQVTKSQVGLGNVVDTGDSATPTEYGTEKFTTGGAYTLKSQLDIKIENEILARQNADREMNTDLNNKINAEKDARIAADAQLQSTKQDFLVNRLNIKSINGKSILGSGNLEVSFDPQTLNDMLCYDIVDEEE